MEIDLKDAAQQPAQQPAQPAQQPAQPAQPAQQPAPIVKESPSPPTSLVNIEVLEKNYESFKELRNKTISLYDELSTNAVNLRSIYVNFIQENSGSDMFIFALDSFHFQNKLVTIEHTSIQTMMTATDNRIYGEYYKLYCLVLEYICDTIPNTEWGEVDPANEFDKYMDLNVDKKYDFEIASEIHQDILAMLSDLNEFHSSEERIFLSKRAKTAGGLQIHNYVNSCRHNLAVIKEQVILFGEYVDVFNKYHTQYVTRIGKKIISLNDMVRQDLNI